MIYAFGILIFKVDIPFGRIGEGNREEEHPENLRTGRRPRRKRRHRKTNLQKWERINLETINQDENITERHDLIKSL